MPYCYTAYKEARRARGATCFQIYLYIYFFLFGAAWGIGAQGGVSAKASHHAPCGAWVSPLRSRVRYTGKAGRRLFVRTSRMVLAITILTRGATSSRTHIGNPSLRHYDRKAEEDSRKLCCPLESGKEKAKKSRKCTPSTESPKGDKNNHKFLQIKVMNATK